MSKLRMMKKSLKGFLSVLLVLSILCSFPVMNIFVSMAEGDPAASGGGDGETAATGDQIYAFLNYIDPNKKTNKSYRNLELVFKNENVKDTNYFKGPFTNFADTEFVTTTYKFDGTGRPSKTWNYNQWRPNETADADKLPWRLYSNDGYVYETGKPSNHI